MIGDADQQLYKEQNSTQWLVEQVWGAAAKLGEKAAAPVALRTTHGTSTRPPTGSQTRPSVFFSASAAAFTH